MASHLILNFEGLDGATSWEDEAQELECTDFANCEIDTGQYYGGSSSLLLNAAEEGNPGYFTYWAIPGINTGSVKLSLRFRHKDFSESEGSGDSARFLIFNGSDGYPSVDIYMSGPSGRITVSCTDREMTKLLTDYDTGVDCSAEAWHSLEVTVYYKTIIVKVDEDEVAYTVADIDNPMQGNFDFYIGLSPYDMADAAKLWIDDVIIEDYDSIIIPTALITLNTHDPSWDMGVPTAVMTLETQSPSFGPTGAIIPVATAALIARTPSGIWSVQPDKLATAQVIYRCVLTGEPDGLSDLTLPMSSFQAWMRDGDPSYLSVVVPSSVTYAADIAARSNGEIVISKGYKFTDDTEQMEEIIRSNYDSIRVDRGARSDSLTMTGYKTTSSSAPKERTLDGVSYYGLQADGKRRVRADLDLFLRVGDTAIYGDGATDYFVVGTISYFVGAEPVQMIMEVGEA
jgi:hypothetical protein